VEHHHVAQVADVGLAVDGDPAQVDPNPAPVAGHERLLAPGGGFVELQDHGGSAPGVEGGELVSYPRTGCSAARQTALAAIPSPRPQKPRPSLLLAVTRTWAGSRPKAAGSSAAIAAAVWAGRAPRETRRAAGPPSRRGGAGGGAGRRPRPRPGCAAASRRR